MSSILNSQIIKQLKKPKRKTRWNVWPNHLFLYEFVSFILRYLSKMQNRTLKHNCSFFPPGSLTAMQCHTDSKDWHKLIFNQNCQRLTSNLVSNNCQIKWQKYKTKIFIWQIKEPKTSTIDMQYQFHVQKGNVHNTFAITT